MKSTTARLRARDVVDKFAERGRYHFSTADMRTKLAVSDAAVRLSLSRLIRKRLIASPARGFYVILPPEYRRLGCLPADQFIPALMAHLKRPYYAALLSASQYHGAAHHRPQTFQVALAEARRPIRCGAIAVSFIVRKRLAEVPLESYNTPRGTIRVSSLEATAIDVVGYQRRIGGLDQVVTILAELAERINPELLVDAARTAPLPWAQRLGYLLESVGAPHKARILKDYVRTRVRYTAPLLAAGSSDTQLPCDDMWRLRINAKIGIDP